MSRFLNWTIVPLIVSLSSCAIFAPDDRTELGDGLSDSFTLYSDVTPDVESRWWENFNSPELNAFVVEGLTNSPSIQQSWARLAQAEAVAVKAGFERFPLLAYGGSASTRTSSGSNGSVENYSLGLNAAYEVDLWGRIKSETQAAALDRSASREQLNAAAITLSSQIVLRWTDIVAQRLKIEVASRQLVANNTALELIELRFQKSLSTALDVFQQRQIVAGTRSQIPLLELREELLMNELSALLGREDIKSIDIEDTLLPLIGEVPTIGIPADLLANRPDIRQAGLRLQSADWSVSASRAARLPAIRLTASGDYLNENLSDLFDNWLANLAANLTGPIFEGGRRNAEVKRTRAVVTERLAAYKEVVIQAVKEVENALVSERKQRIYIEALDDRLLAAKRSYEESVNRYRNGVIEYTTVLFQLTPLQNLERERVEAQYDLLQYRIDLYRALGGAWPNELQPPVLENEESK